MSIIDVNIYCIYENSKLEKKLIFMFSLQPNPMHNVLFQPVSSISRLLCSQGRVRTRLVPNYVRTMFVLTF